MTTTTRRRNTAPYQVGGTIRLLHDGPGGTTVADLPVREVKALADGRWRITAERGGSYATVEVTVGADGRDAHGYVQVPA